MKEFYKAISVFLIGTIILLSSCKSQDDVIDLPPTPKFFVENQSVITDNLPEDLRLLDGIATRGDGYFTVLAETEDKIKVLKIYDDNTVENIETSSEIPNKQYIALYHSDTGFTAVSLYSENGISGVVFDSYDMNFNLKNSVNTDFPFYNLHKIIYDGTDYYILTYDEMFSRSLRRFGSDFSFLDEPYEEPDSTGQSLIRSITLGSDGKVYVIFDSSGESYSSYIVPYSPVKTDTSLTEITDDKHCTDYFPGWGNYLFFGNDNAYIYGIKSVGEIDMLMPISDLDIPYLSVITEAEISGEMRTAFYSDYDTNEIFRVNNIVKIPDKDTRLLLKLTVNSADSLLINTVSAFNRISTKYKVEIDETVDRNNPMINGFDKAIIDGSLGDIIIAPEYANVNYTEKGIYFDLYEFLDNDENFNRDMFLPHILDALETDGKLLRLWNQFGFDTYVAAENALPPTFANIYKLIEDNPDKIILPTYPNDAAAIFTELLQKNSGYFADLEKSGGDEMRTLLEFCKKSGENPISEEDYYTRFAKGKGYYNRHRISGISWFIIATEIEPAGEKYSVPVGNPVPSGEPLVYLYGTDIAINNASENKAGAWEFIKFYLSYRERIHSGFPVLANEYNVFADETAAETAKLKLENGEDYSNSNYNTPYLRTPVRLPVREDFDAVLELLPGSVVPKNTDKDLLVIITEEAEQYFDGEKSIDETLDVIKNRAEIYIAERQ
jgi:ABC-type glycerol-3-phosphate transport system substrate-binding protein